MPKTHKIEDLSMTVEVFCQSKPVPEHLQEQFIEENKGKKKTKREFNDLYDEFRSRV